MEVIGSGRRQRGKAVKSRTRLPLMWKSWVVLVCMTASHNCASAQSESKTARPEIIDSASLAVWCDVLFRHSIADRWDRVEVTIDSDKVLTPLIRFGGPDWNGQGRYALTPFLSQTTTTSGGKTFRAFAWDEVDLEAYLGSRDLYEGEFVNGSFVAVVELTKEDTIVRSIQRVEDLLPRDETQTYPDLWPDRTSNIKFGYLGEPHSLILRVAKRSNTMGMSAGSHNVFERFFQVAADCQLRFLRSFATEGTLWDRHGPDLDWEYRCELMDCDKDGANELLYGRTGRVTYDVSSVFRESGISVFELVGGQLVCDRFMSSDGISKSLHGRLPEWVLPFPQPGFESSLDSADKSSVTAIEEDLKYKFSFSTKHLAATSDEDRQPLTRLICRASDDSLLVFITDAGVYPSLICLAPATSGGIRPDETRLFGTELSGPDSSLVYAWSGNDNNRVGRWVTSSVSRFRTGKYDGPDYVISIPWEDAYLPEFKSGLGMFRFAFFVFEDGVPADGSGVPRSSFPIGAKLDDPSSWGNLLVVDRQDSASWKR